ncbi:monocarboxylate transporter 3-like [Ruditapes philippinarum]|uniref:monocarboxylate transporter 3-like n=1 Tax=Ruditapes philippinarum TaxID=129788 RepID=UPI00295BD2AD|nr:monocarboxylate transporter 3-like [Ruditapes philippinarum]
MSSVAHDDVDKGRAWIILMTVYCLVIFQCTTLYMNGLYLAVLMDLYNEDLTKTSMIGALNSALLNLMGPVVSVFMDIYSCRTCMFVGGILLSISYFTSFFSNSIDVYIVTIGIIGGIGNAYGAMPQSVFIAYNFEKMRNIALSFREVLVGVGMFIASPLLFWLIETFGINGSFLIVSGINLQICVGSLICWPNSKERNLKRMKTKQTNEDRSTFTTIYQKLKSSIKLSLILLKNRQLVLFMLSTLSWNFLLSACSLHLPRYMVTRGFGDASVVSVMTVFSISNTLGRLCAAATVGSGGIDSNILQIGMLGVLSFSTILFPLYGQWSYSGFVLAVLSGFYCGGPNALLTPITVGLIGIEKMSSGYGLLIFFCGIGVLTGPPVLAIIYSWTDSYDYSFMTIGFVVLLGMFSSLMAFSKADSPENTNIEIDVAQNDNGVMSTLLDDQEPVEVALLDKNKREDLQIDSQV